MAILYGNQVNETMKQEYFMLLAQYIVSLTDFQDRKLDEILKPTGRIIKLKESLTKEALSYINSRGVGDIQ